MLEKMNHYSMTNPASVYDEEALTALELSARTATKMNQTIDAFNELEQETENHLKAQDTDIQNQKDVVIPNRIRTEVQNQIDNGTFDQQISDYAGGLESRLNNLLGSVVEGSTSMDSEVIDMRVRENGLSYPTAGEALRSIGEELQTVISGNLNIVHSMDWAVGYFINSKGEVREATTGNWVVASHKFPKGSIIDYELYATENTCVLAIGDDEKAISGLRIGEAQGTPTIGTYIVENEWEHLYFMTGTINGLLENSKIFVRDEKADLLRWTMGYVDATGSIVTDGSRLYAYSDPIFVPAMHQISAKMEAPSGVATISVCDETGLILGVGRIGEGLGDVKEYTFVSNQDTYVRLCSRVNESYTLNSITYTIKEYTEKFRTPTFTIGNGHISSSENKVVGDSVYKYTSYIRLFPGETIRFHSAGSAGIWCLSEWELIDGTQTFVRGLIQGNNRFRVQEYTNESPFPVLVRVSAKCIPSSAKECVITFEEFANNITVFYKDNFYRDVKNHPLYGKRITILGDSLFFGNIIGPDGTWLHNLALKYNMVETNMGVNGSPFTNLETAGMVNRYPDIPPSDYIVVGGGSNDARVGAVMGDTSSTDPSTFCGAINTIIDGIRELHPEAKLLFVTTMNRFGTEQQLVKAMENVCEVKGVPCYNAFKNLGLYYLDDNTVKWADEGVVLNYEYTQGEMNLSMGNKHLSRDAYKYVTPKYEALLTGL